MTTFLINLENKNMFQNFRLKWFFGYNKQILTELDLKIVVLTRTFLLYCGLFCFPFFIGLMSNTGFYRGKLVHGCILFSMTVVTQVI